MAIKINAKILGIKEPIEVKQSGTNITKSLKIQREALKLQSFDDDTTEDEIIESGIKAQELPINFISDILRLKPKETEKLWDLDRDDVSELFTEIILKLQDQDPEEVKKAQAEEAAKNAELSDTEKK